MRWKKQKTKKKQPTRTAPAASTAGPCPTICQSSRTPPAPTDLLLSSLLVVIWALSVLLVSSSFLLLLFSFSPPLVFTVSSLDASPLGTGIFGLFGSANEVFSHICNIPSSSRLSLLISGDELMCHLITMTFAKIPQVWFRSIVVNSPFTANSFWSVRSLIWLSSRYVSSKSKP